MKIVTREKTMRVLCPHGSFASERYLLEQDSMGYTVTKTTIKQGGPYYWHYKHHLESCLCVSGHATVQDCAAGTKHDLGPGDLYALDKNDAHTFTAHDEVVLVCVFSPALTGSEVHQKDGSYKAGGNKK